MASLIGTLYPPVIDTFMPAFVYTDAVRVYYSLPAYSDLNNITCLHVTLVDQETNQNALNNNAGIYIIKNPLQFYDEDKQQYYVDIPPSLTKLGNFKCNQFYKVQLRFDCNAGTVIPIGTNVSAAAINKYVMNVDNQAYFSEWSTVCLIRPIYEPKLEIVGFSDEYQTELKPNINRGILPLSGRLWFRNENGDIDTKEQLYSYQISIVDENENVLLSSDLIYTSDSFNNNNINTVLNLMNVKLDNSVDQSLYLKIQYTTGNLYTNTVKLSFNLVPYASDISPFFENEQNIYRYILDDENGYVNLIAGFVDNETIQPEENAFFYLMRSSSEDNFDNWQIMFSDYFTSFADYAFEDISTILTEESTSIAAKERIIEEATYSELNKLKNYKIIDNTVQSMTWYKYCIQYLIPKEDSNGDYDLTQPYYFTLDGVREDVFPQFYDLLLTRGSTQIPLRFNLNISSYKKNVSRTKIDTLGGRYPKFAENAAMNYRQYSISGTISANMDDMKTFMRQSDFFTDEEVQTLYMEYIKEKNCSHIDLSTVTVDTIGYDYYEWLWERVFREKLYDWLNDGEPKLMRSMTEGNVIVMLNDISLTPNAQLSRLISDFSCTAYEVGDGSGSLDQLRQLRILGLPANNYDPVITAEPTNTLLVISNGTPVQVAYSDYLNGTYNIYIANCRYDINSHKGDPTLTNTNFIDVIKDKIILDEGYGSEGVNRDRVLQDFYVSNIKINFGAAAATRLYLKDGIWSRTNSTGATSAVGHLIILNDDTQIFTNQSTYEIPQGFTVTSLKFDESTIAQIDKIQVDCVAYYTLDSIQETKFVRVVENIVGQYNQVFHPTEWLDKKIKAEQTYIDSASNTKVYLQSWNGMYIETSIPNSAYAIRNLNGAVRKDFILSDTNGLCDIFGLGQIKDIAYMGRLMRYGEYQYSNDILTKDYKRDLEEIPNYIEKTQKWLVPAYKSSPFDVAIGIDNSGADKIIDTFVNHNQYIIDDDIEVYDFKWGNIYDNTSLSGKMDFIEDSDVNIDIYMETLPSGIENPTFVPSYWKIVPIVNTNGIVMIDNHSFVDITKMTKNYIYNINSNPYIRIDNTVYPVILLTEDNIAIKLSDFEDIRTLKNIIVKIIVPIIEENGFFNYYGQLVKEKRENL